MGLLSNIVSGVKKSVVGKALDTLSAAFIKPAETIQAILSPTKTVAQVIQKVDAQPLSKNITATVINTAVAATAVIGVGAAIKAVQAGTLLPALIPATTKGKVIAAVAAPIIIGAVANQPAKTAEAVINAPTALGNVGGNIASLIADPSLENLKTLVKENPVIVGGAVAAGAVAAGAAATSLVSAALTRSEMKQQTAAFERQATAAEELLKTGSQTTNLVAATPTEEPITVVDKTYHAEGAPVAPSTQKVSSKSSIKRKKRILKPSMQNISQRTNVIVQNRNIGTTTKRYINRIPLYN